MSVSCNSLPIVTGGCCAPKPDEALVAQLCRSFAEKAGELKAVEVRMGLGYTAVQLEDGRCGLAYTFRHETNFGCGAFRAAGELQGRRAAELLGYAETPDVLGAAVALATANALAEVPPDEGIDGFDLMQMQPTDTAGMVGFFGPLIENVKKRVQTLNVFERIPNFRPDVLPDTAEPEILPQCQVVIITATALINRTIDQVLAHCQKAREVMILGASTPYSPELLAARGVTILSGVRVVDAARALQVASEGGGTQRLNPAMRRYSLRIAASRS